MKKKRHLTPDEIKKQLNMIAREKRMADRTPYSAMNILMPYTIMKCEGFKAQRIVRILNKVNDMQEKWENGEIDLEEVSQRLMDKAEWTIASEHYQESDIIAKKGTYQHLVDKLQIEPQNRINDFATRYMLFFFTALMEEYRFGKERLTRVQEYLNNILLEYQEDKTSVDEWKKELFDKAGLVIEMPIDPLTQTHGSIMTG